MILTPRTLLSAAAPLVWALVLVLAASAQAHAGCTVSSSQLVFGVYQPLSFAGRFGSVAVTSMATVSVTCDRESGLAGHTLTLGPSPVGGHIGMRYLAHSGGGNPMLFNVYTDPTHLTVWGDGSSGATLRHGALDGHVQHTVYGKIPAGQNTLQAGSFSGLLTMTLTYNP